jgi:predicted phage terminase large subunit-like protein
MLIQQLRDLEKRCLQNEHYQYKSSNLNELARKSFLRLSEPQKEQVIGSWKKYCDKQKILCDFEEALRYRFIAQTNLFFLCHLLEKYNKTTEQTHEEICNDFFVTKDPVNYSTFEDFANNYKLTKDRMLLVPRGGFKSSIDMADVVQWIICFPEITILILTGVYKLAEDFVGEIKSHFTFEQVGETEKGKPIYGPKTLNDNSVLMFQVLFPEHCVSPQEGKATEFATPGCKMPDKEPTVSAASIEQALSGMHFGILKLDDVVTNENSLTLARMEAVNKQISINRAMMHPFGFMDVIGTWYDERDYYGITIKSEEEIAKEEGCVEQIVGSIDSGIFNSNVTVKIYLRAAWWPTEEARRLGKIEEEMTKDDWVLWFPERLPYEFLIKEKRKPNNQFDVKYLNNPRLSHQVKFPRELLVRRTVPHTQLPNQGLIVSAIDTAYSVQAWADYTSMITALIYGGRFYIIDLVRNRFNEYDLPKMIAQTGFKWKSKQIVIEDDKGVRWLNREVRREMDSLKISIPIREIPINNTKNAKVIRAKPVARLLGDERLFFANSCNSLDDLYTELESFRGDGKKHDDVVSSLSLLVEEFLPFADMDARVNFVQTEYVADTKSRERHDQIYGLGKYSKYNASNFMTFDDHPVTQYEAKNQQENFVDFDPLSGLL